MPISIPTTSALPPSQLLPSSHPTVHKTLSRLSRASLLSLALDWLEEQNQELSAPFLYPSSNSPSQDLDDQDPDDAYPPSTTLPDLRQTYTDLQVRKGSKRDVLDRILEGDWRHGISLYQLAMADMQCLYERPGRERWSALRIVRVGGGTNGKDKWKGVDTVPRFHPSTFLRNLQREVLPDVKAHYNLDRHTELPLWILRVWIVDSPYDTALALRDTSVSRTFYIAFPDAAPYIYISLTSGAGSLRKLTLESVPRAFSRPGERFRLEKTELSAKNLTALCARRGAGRGNAVGGGWGVYIEGGDNPLGGERGVTVGDDRKEDGKEERGMKRKREQDLNLVKRRKALAQGRFGNSARRDDGKGIERLDIRLEDRFPDVNLFVEIDTDAGRRKKDAVDLENYMDWRPDVRITFQGPHVFAGVRELVENGIVDGERMPGWMTGEEGVSIGVVREGRVEGWKGSGV